MATAEKIIKQALRSIGVLSRGYTPEPEEMNEGLDALNGMIAGWETDLLVVPYRTRESFSLTIGKREYTIGPTGADLTTSARPIVIDNAWLRDNVSIDYELDPYMTNVEEGRVTYKDNQGRPCRLYYERGDPNGTIRFDYSIEYNDTLFLDMLKPLSQFATLTSADQVPERYVEALRFNLAIRLAPDYTQPVSKEVAAIARETKRSIEVDNARFRVPTLAVDPGLQARRRRTYGSNINDGY